MIKKSIIIVAVIFLSISAKSHKSWQKQKFILFWRSDCEACHVAIPQIVKKIETLDTTKFVIMAVSFDTDSASYYKTVEELNMKSFIHLFDFHAGYTYNTLAKKYHITKTPTLICLDKNDNVMAIGNEAFKLLSNFKQ
jgi:thioredoxin-related protein